MKIYKHFINISISKNEWKIGIMKCAQCKNLQKWDTIYENLIKIDWTCMNLATKSQWFNLKIVIAYWINTIEIVKKTLSNKIHIKIILCMRTIFISLNSNRWTLKNSNQMTIDSDNKNLPINGRYGWKYVRKNNHMKWRLNFYCSGERQKNERQSDKKFIWFAWILTVRINEKQYNSRRHCAVYKNFETFSHK